MTATDYLGSLDFEADRFQLEAAASIDRGASVVVTAPTGSGKTAIAEAAIHRAHEANQRAMYTTPIKALSNQKFADFQRQYGESNVGLLTGDNSINGSAPIVVMTTEVLRNMMYANSADLDDVGVVVLDEVHYLQDRARGGVWEEIIVHLDRSIPLVCLSATIANADEFAAWIRERRGQTDLVIEHERPVPLDVTYLVRDKYAGNELRLFPVFSGGRPNERLATMMRRDRGKSSRYVAPRRHESCELMRRQGLLPAIFFIFSRRGCEAAAKSVVERGLRLTSSSEADEIEAYARAATAHLDAGDLEVLGYARWLELIRRGVAAHHAGMVPAMKEAVEQLFSRGLIRVVFATETLALGINMPARTVVLESLSKFTGESHETLKAGEFTQLTGRAGRRGIDKAGTAVVLHSPYLEFERVAGIAARGSHPLRSSFRPTYNMAVNLIARYDRSRAETLLAASFAEFSRTKQRAAAGEDLESDMARLAQLRAEAEYPGLDIWEELDRDGRSHSALMGAFVSSVGPGDVLEWEERGKTRRVVVVARGTGKQPRLLAVTESGEGRRFASGKFPASLKHIGAVELRRPFKPRDAGYRARVARQLADFSGHTIRTAYATSEDGPDLSQHLAAARSARRLEARIESHRRRIAAVGPAVVRRFRAITGVLEEFGYIDGWSLTEKGMKLRSLYNELDLVLAGALESGVFSDLSPSEVVGLASAFTYEARRAETSTTWPQEVTGPGAEIEERWERISAAEKRRGLDPSRAPDPGFAGPIAAWASGATLSELFGDEDAGIGDFVRNARQLIDLLHQIEDLDVIPAATMRQAIRGVDRGVVAAAGAV